MAGIDALALYGTLVPGGPNHWVLNPVKGEWTAGFVRGYQFEITWGPADGEPGFMPDSDGHRVKVAVLLAEDLSRWWPTLDGFQGEGYGRERIDVSLDDGSSVNAAIYVAFGDI